MKGLDLEASYRAPLSDIVDGWAGDVSFRAIATHAIKNATNTGVLITNTAGANGASVPSWSMTLNAGYNIEPFRITWTGRYISSGTISNDFIECAAGTCPNPIPAGKTTIDVNHVASYFTSDFSFAYRFYQDGGQNAEAFLTIDNAFDKDPARISQDGNAYSPHTNANLYDVLGRSFRGGIRFRY